MPFVCTRACANETPRLYAELFGFCHWHRRLNTEVSFGPTRASHNTVNVTRRPKRFPRSPGPIGSVRLRATVDRNATGAAIFRRLTRRVLVRDSDAIGTDDDARAIRTTETDCVRRRGRHTLTRFIDHWSSGGRAQQRPVNRGARRFRDSFKRRNGVFAAGPPDPPRRHALAVPLY